jgi:hypothetical protein
MYNIILLSSFHIECGKCNSKELYKIIENIQPEIIFEELPQQVFNIIYAEGSSPKSLEAITIKKYIKEKQIEHFPVDTYKIYDKDIFDSYDIISNKSIEYNDLFKQQLSMINIFGYSFLNSDDCVEFLDKMHIIEENTLLEINNSSLIRQYKLNSELDDKRENEMLKNIYNYSKQYQFNKAIFICGVDHRKSMMIKIPVYEKELKFKLNWEYFSMKIADDDKPE